MKASRTTPGHMYKDPCMEPRMDFGNSRSELGKNECFTPNAYISSIAEIHAGIHVLVFGRNLCEIVVWGLCGGGLCVLQSLRPVACTSHALAQNACCNCRRSRQCSPTLCSAVRIGLTFVY
jgi:hypothetical protein